MITAGSFREMFRETSLDLHPPLFYTLLLLWRRIFPTPGAMRVFTAFFGLVATLSAGAIAARLYGRRAGVLAMLLFAAFPQLIFYSVFARMYSLCLALELLALLGWLIASDRPRLGFLIFTGASAAVLYTQNLGAFFVSALFCWCAAETAFGGGRWWSAGTVTKKRSWTWLLAAGIAVGLAFAPWLPVLFRQSHNPGVRQILSPPSLRQILVGIFLDPYSLGGPSPWGWASWIPGVLLFSILPLVSLFAGRRLSTQRTKTGESWNDALPFWLGCVSLAIIVCVSIVALPIFEFAHHSVLFIPFILLGSAGVLARTVRKPASQTVLLIAVASMSLFAWNNLRITHHPDLRIPRDVLVEKAPLGVPIVGYPIRRFIPPASFHWEPLQFHDYDQIPEVFPECTLIVSCNATGREHVPEILDQTRLIVDKAKPAKVLYLSYDYWALHLSGLPPGAVRGLVHGSGHGGETPLVPYGDGWTRERDRSAEDLIGSIEPPGELFNLDATQQAMRLSATVNRIALARGEDSGSDYRVAIVLGRVKNDGPQTEIRILGAAQEPWVLRAESGNFAFSQWRLPGRGGGSIEIGLPRELLRDGASTQGNKPNGMCFMRIIEGRVPLTFFRNAGTNFVLDVGSLNDLFFIRDGFYEKEGTAPNDYRWTQKDFNIDVPIWRDAPKQKVLLSGSLPAAIADRSVSLSITVRGDGSAIQRVGATRTIPTGDFGDFEFDLPESIQPGVARLHFSLGGSWSPKEIGAGGDPRRLGFFLSAVTLE